VARIIGLLVVPTFFNLENIYGTLMFYGPTLTKEKSAQPDLLVTK